MLQAGMSIADKSLSQIVLRDQVSSRQADV